ncbi:cell envelope integrity protein CreD [Comamonas testosteroni]|uniref:cell envelope integrity protein CreD n=1 Tax=Comamonas testosteroni TaxID=285 RepID=UPI0026F093D2|nr:cell envelope integrity protein CreD [Comamonas testosteroni]WQD44073.1 cell envelope integrity protein CreD [Comamonas testosteroni]
MKNRLLFKTVSLLIVLALLMAGLSMIQDVVKDRIRNRDYAVQSVVSSLAGTQTLIGPALVQSCTETTSTTNGKKIEYSTREFQRMLLPDTLNHDANAKMEERSRGLHHINTYVLHDQISASFANAAQYAALPKPSEPNAVVRCKKVLVAFALSDPRGIRSATLQANGQDLAVESGTPLERYGKGIQAEIDASLLKKGEALNLDLKLQLLGTEQLAFSPIATESKVTLTADWPHPSFGGSFLPSRREVTDSGFTASWELSSLATSASTAFTRQQRLCNPGYWGGSETYAASAARSHDDSGPCLETMDTEFVNPVNVYSLSERATKYGILFVILTFVAVGLFEVMKKLRVHPVQYLLVGSALCSFFLLLISLSEHLGFATAYAIAASSCVALLAFYASHILGSIRRGLPFAVAISALYGLLYVLLQLEQTALVVGSIALFGVLALVMICTRHVDWYAFGRTESDAPSKSSKQEEAA